MAIDLVKNEIDQFLSRENDEVLCISGAWGAGKTHLWKDRITNVAVNDTVRRYAYVSLFGLNSLAEVKQAIFENSVPIASKDEAPSIETLKGFVNSVEGFSRKAAWFGNNLARNYTGDLSPAFFLTVRNHLVCFDDLERRGSDLRIEDVLGLVSYLKEERSCRCVLLLNKEKIIGEAGDAFDSYLEKVADGFLRLSPTPQELTAIAIQPDTPVKSAIEARCIELGISNIRTIRRCESFVGRVMPLIEGNHDKTKAQAIQTLTLLCWCIFDPESAPSIEFIEKKRLSTMFDESKNLTEKEAGWNALLDAYNFSVLDEFDDTLLKGLRDGYFSKEEVEKHAQALDARYEESSLSDAYNEAWNNIYGSFGNNENEVVERLKTSFLESSQFRGPSDLNALIKLLKSLERRGEALELLDKYIENKKDEDPDLFDIAQTHWIHETPDEDLAMAFEKIYHDGKSARSFKDILINIGKTNGWNNEDEERLSLVTEDEFYDLFKDNSGQELSLILSGAFNWARVSNASPSMKAMLKRVRNALRRLGEENRINALRVHRLGISLTDPKTPPSDEVASVGEV